MATHHGSCHCGAVRFTLEAPPVLDALACNCSICKKTQYVQTIHPQSRFRLLEGEDALTEYRFNTRVARHTFCKVCGVKPFYTPRSNPDGVAVNVHCLDPATVEKIRVEPFDGENWEAHAAGLAQRSRDE